MASFDDLRESLGSSSVAALIAKRISPMLLDYVRRENPLEAALPVTSWDTDRYFFNQVNKMPLPQAVQEAPATSGTGSVTATQSNYVQKSFPIAHYQVNGDISTFAEKVARVSVADLLQLEMQRSATAMRWFRNLLHIYGSASAGSTYRPQWDGLDRQIATTNIISPLAGQGGTIALQDLDNAIDTVRTIYADTLAGGNWFFLSTPEMLSQINRLLISSERFTQPVTMKARRDDGVVGHQVVEVDAGIEVASYRGIPFIVSSFLKPNGAFGTVTASAAGSDGTQVNAAKYFYVEAITQMGPSLPSPVATVTPTAAQHIDLTFTKPTILDPFGNTMPIIQYRVYAGSTTGYTNCSLYGVVGANSAADNDVVVIRDFGNSIQAGEAALANPITGLFTGASNVAGDGVNFTAAAPAAGSIAPIYLVSRDPNFLTVPTVTDLDAQILAPVNARSIQYAVVGDCALAMRAGAFASKIQLAKTQ